MRSNSNVGVRIPSPVQFGSCSVTASTGLLQSLRGVQIPHVSTTLFWITKQIVPDAQARSNGSCIRIPVGIFRNAEIGYSTHETLVGTLGVRASLPTQINRKVFMINY